MNQSGVGRLTSWAGARRALIATLLLGKVDHADGGAMEMR
jgi:hypothetical protein